MYILSPFAWLWIIELLGFIVIGGKIGFFLSLLWLIGATWLGFRLLAWGGMKALEKGAADEDGFFAAQDAFDSLCLMIAAILLLIPGFVSDIVAIPFLVGPFRSWLFSLSRKQDSFMRKFTRESRTVREWTYTHTQRQRAEQEKPGANTTIEGDFRRVDDPKDQLRDK